MLAENFTDQITFLSQKRDCKGRREREASSSGGWRAGRQWPGFLPSEGSCGGGPLSHVFRAGSLPFVGPTTSLAHQLLVTSPGENFDSRSVSGSAAKKLFRVGNRKLGRPSVSSSLQA